jgi:hypothetical protein
VEIPCLLGGLKQQRFFSPHGVMEVSKDPLAAFGESATGCLKPLVPLGLKVLVDSVGLYLPNSI